MPLFRRREAAPEPQQNALRLATELGVLHASDGRPAVTDPALIRRYVEAYVDIRDGERLPEHLMAEATMFYAQGYEEGSRPPVEPVHPRIHDALAHLDKRVADG